MDKCPKCRSEIDHELSGPRSPIYECGSDYLGYQSEQCEIRERYSKQLAEAERRANIAEDAMSSLAKAGNCFCLESGATTACPWRIWQGCSVCSLAFHYAYAEYEAINA